MKLKEVKDRFLSMIRSEHEKTEEIKVRVRVKPNGALVQMITLDPETLLEKTNVNSELSRVDANSVNKPDR